MRSGWLSLTADCSEPLASFPGFLLHYECTAVLSAFRRLGWALGVLGVHNEFAAAQKRVQVRCALSGS